MQETAEAAKPNKKDSTKTIQKTRPEKIRVELNVEKWPAIWRPASSNKSPSLRTLERGIALPDGTRGTAKLEVGFTHLGTITTEDQKMFYALIRHWEENGKPADRPVYFSDRVIARLLKKRGWGTNVITAITASLRRLRTTPLRWIKSYHRQESPDREMEEETLFNFLDTLKIVTRKEHGHVTNQQGYFQFDREILSNLLHQYTKPLLDEEFFRLQTEIGQLLYTHVDLILATKDERGRMRTFYERKTRDLFYDLGLLQENSSYKYPSNRKQALLRPVAELQGCRLSTGVLKSIVIEKTSDGKDYKVVFQKGRVQDEVALAQAESPPAKPEPEARAAVVVNHYAKPENPTLRQAQELISHFYKIFHSVDNHQPQTREMTHAMSLISQHGLVQAKQIVDFAHTESAKTDYFIQHFGGILSYASRAVASLERSKAAAMRKHDHVESHSQIGIAEASPQKFPRGERRFLLLSQPEQHGRLEQVRAELLAKNSFLARWKGGSALHQEMIRARAVRKLDQECMELVLVDGRTDPEALRRKLGLQNLAV
jgi:hypothetical protein